MFESLVISKTSLTFDPNTLDPLVRDRGIEDFKFVISLEDITYAALTKDCYPPHRYCTPVGELYSSKIQYFDC